MNHAYRSLNWRLARAAAAVLAFVLVSADRPERKEFTLTDDMRAALDRISANSLRGHLSFLASDLLEGRGTPSRGLDLAAEYIAAQFRRAGLEPAGDDGYFQRAPWRVVEASDLGFSLEIRSGDQTIRVDKGQISRQRPGAVDVSAAGIVKVAADRAGDLTAEQVEGKAVLTELAEPGRLPPAERLKAHDAMRAFVEKVTKLRAAIIVLVNRDPEGGTGLGFTRLLQPDGREVLGSRPDAAETPQVVVHDPDVVKLFDAMADGESPAKLSAHIAAPVEKTIHLRNAVGLLRGSDPALRDTYVLVTAHYDHLGLGYPVKGDRIFNGANDDGSGTASVIELAGALGSLKNHPARSLVFLTFFGEEHGMLGSRYYADHPVFPIDQTVADMNLEQVGRTDSTEGDNTLSASVTGMDYSTMGPLLQAAGEREGIRVYKHEKNSDRYFGASDNGPFAMVGVPAHTVCVSFAYADYHGAGDHWEKVDFANMAKVDRMVGLSLLMLADDPEPPRWNEDNPRAARFVKAWKERHKNKP